MKRKTDTEEPSALDVAFGARVKAIRKSKILSQDQLGRMIGVTFQQVQKYEHGTNRISFSRLVQIADAFEMSPHDLIGELGNGRRNTNAKTISAVTLLAQPMVSDMIDAFQKITNRTKQRALLNMVRQMAEGK